MVGGQLTAPEGRGVKAPRPVLMIVHSYYDEDPRVRREAEALVASGRPVLVLGLRRPGEPADGELAGVRIRRLDVQRHQGASLFTYLAEYADFLLRAGWTAVRAHRRERFALAQVASLPDYLVFAVLPLKLAGVPVILDLHEAMPEFFRSRFPKASNPIAHRLLLLQERLSIALSTATLVVNEAMRDRLLGLGVRADKVHVVINSPSLKRFDAAAYPRRSFREDGPLRLVYTGGLTPTYELDVVIPAVATIATERPDLDVRLAIYGRGDSEAALQELAGTLGVARPRDVPRPHPDRRRPGGRGRGGHRHRPHATRPVHGPEPLDQGLRVRGDGQAGRGQPAAAGRADLPRRLGQHVRARRPAIHGRRDRRPRR